MLQGKGIMPPPHYKHRLRISSFRQYSTVVLLRVHVSISVLLYPRGLAPFRL